MAYELREAATRDLDLAPEAQENQKDRGRKFILKFRE
jgi:hypothetical protein